MTQPEDDAARLARECAEAFFTPRTVSLDAKIHDSFVRDVAPIIRAHLAERDARERMAREAANHDR